MTKDEALKRALEALDCLKRDFDADQFEWGIADESITAIKEALAQPEQKPIEKNMTLACPSYLHDYTSPPQRTWVGLTDEERDEICLGDESIARSIEAKLREKNGGNHGS